MGGRLSAWEHWAVKSVFPAPVGWVITRGREQAGAYFRGLDRAITRYSTMGFIYFAQQDPQVLRALHETHRSLMTPAAPKSRWSWLPWKRKR